jgi:hypothetical protein
LKEFMLVVNDMWTMGKGIHDTCDYTCAEVCHAQTNIVGPSTIRCNATNYSIFHYLKPMEDWIVCIIAGWQCKGLAKVWGVKREN